MFAGRVGWNQDSPFFDKRGYVYVSEVIKRGKVGISEPCAAHKN